MPTCWGGDLNSHQAFNVAGVGAHLEAVGRRAALREDEGLRAAYVGRDEVLVYEVLALDRVAVAQEDLRDAPREGLAEKRRGVFGGSALLPEAPHETARIC